MNPFTQALLGHIPDQQLIEFVNHWDRLEELVIRVYKSSISTEADEADYQILRISLIKSYPHWQPELDPHWRKARMAGELSRQDPFAFLIAIPFANGFVGNWTAMQTLPAAREAINSYLMDITGRAFPP